MYSQITSKKQKNKKKLKQKNNFNAFKKKTIAPQEAKKICSYKFKIGDVYCKIIIKIDRGISIGVYIWLVVCRVQLFRCDLFNNQGITKIRRFKSC